MLPLTVRAAEEQELEKQELEVLEAKGALTEAEKQGDQKNGLSKLTSVDATHYQITIDPQVPLAQRCCPLHHRCRLHLNRASGHRQWNRPHPRE